MAQTPGVQVSGAAWQVNCEFCGSTVLPGAKLCAACRSALKRARNEPSSVLQPLVKRASDTLQRRKSRKSGDAGDARAAAVIPPAVDGRRSAAPAYIGAIAVAICVIGYVILQHRDDGARADPAQASVSEPAASAAASKAPLDLAPLAILALPAIEDIDPAPRAPVSAARKHPKINPAIIAPLPMEVTAPVAQPIAPPVAIAATPAAPPDRRTQLRNRFAGCASTEVLAQAYCEQRARIELCDGLWGSVPQCPPQRDYGS